MGDKEYRIRQQWEQSGLEKIWLVNVSDGSRKLVRDKVRGGGLDVTRREVYPVV